MEKKAVKTLIDKKGKPKEMLLHPTFSWYDDLCLYQGKLYYRLSVYDNNGQGYEMIFNALNLRLGSCVPCYETLL